VDRLGPHIDFEDLEASFRCIFEDASDAIVVFEPASAAGGRIIAANNAACTLLDCSEGDARLIEIGDVVEPEDLPRLLAAQDAEHVKIRLAGRNSNPFDADARIRLLPGGTRAVLFLRPVPEEEAKVEERDLTWERKLLKQVIDSAPNLIYVKDRFGRYLLVNKATADLLGMDADELVGKSTLQYGFPSSFAQQRERLRQQDREILDTRREYHTEVEYRRPGQPSRWFSAIKTPLIDEDGSCNKILVVATEFTQRKLMEEALRESESQFRRLAEALPQLVWMARPDGFHVYFNQRWFDYTGTTMETSGGEMWSNLLHPEDYERTVAYWRHCLNTGEPYTIEYRFCGRDGQYRWFIGRALPVRNEKGEILRWFGTCTDINDVKIAQQELAKAAEQRRLALEGGNLGTWDLDISTNTTFWDERCRALFGRTEEALGIDRVFDTMHPDDRDAIRKAVADAIDPKIAARYDVEYRVVSPGAPTRWIAARGKAFFEGEGRFKHATRFVGTVQDITDRKNYEQALKAREREYKALAENTPEIIARFDRRFRHAFINEYGARVYGMAIEDIIGKSSKELGMPPEKVRFWEENFEEVFRTKRQKNVDFDFDSPTFGHQFLSSMFVPEFDEQGQVNSILAITRDITARRDVEEALKQTTQNLARSNKDLEQFAYVVSHDLQEPLRQVTGFVQLLARRYGDSLDPEAQEYMSFIEDGATRMRGLILDLLAYSRVTSAGQNIAPTDAGKALATAIQNLAGSINETGAVITSDALPVINADPVQLAQVFQNLIGNAIKFRGDKTPEIHVGVRQEKKIWLFSVSDNGIGFSSEFADKIFQLFQRLHTRDRYAGTGIGLSICKRVIERHGGKIWAKSTPGEGSTFYFTLPA
jgi:PAS domain S-box-containing protein